MAVLAISFPQPPSAPRIELEPQPPPEEDAVEPPEETEDAVPEPPPRPDVLAGRVLLPAGVPVSLVQVRVSADLGPEGPAFRQILDVSPTGAWHIEGLAPRTYGVSVSFRWRGRRYHGGVRAAAGTNAVEIPLEADDPAPREILIRLFDVSGEPVRHGWVAVHPLSRPDAPSSVQVDEGQAVLEIFEGHGPLWFEAWSGPGAHRGSTVVGPVADLTDVYEIRLGEPRTIQGAALDADGAPASGFQVTARVIGHAEKTWHAHASTTTDEQGRFVLRGLGNHVYEVSAEGPADAEPLEPQLLRGGVENAVFKLRGSITVEVTVLDPDGRPVEGALVAAVVWSVPTDHASGTTDAKGVVLLWGLNPDLRYRLTVSAKLGGLRPHRLTIDSWKPHATTVHLKP